MQKALTLLGETLSGKSDEFFEKWRKFRQTNNFARQSFALQDNHYFSNWLVTLLGPLGFTCIIQLKTFLLLLSKIDFSSDEGDECFIWWRTFRRTNSFVRRTLCPKKFRPIRYHVRGHSRSISKKLYLRHHPCHTLVFDPSRHIP